jgi:hypothetical protein
MGSSRNKMLNQQEALARQQYQQAFTQAQQQSPAEKAMQERNLAFLNWYDTAGKDITQAPGLSPYLQIGAAARKRAQSQRMGMGAMQLGTGSEGYAAKLREQYAQEAAQNYGTGLEQAVTGRYAEATGSMLPLAQLAANRSMGLLSSAQGREQGYLNAPRETPFWKTFLIEGMRGAAQIGAAAAMPGG